MHRLLFIFSIPLVIITVIALLLPSVSLPKKEVIGCSPIDNVQALANEYDPKAATGIFGGTVVYVPSLEFSQASAVLGESVGDKRIEVDLANQRVYAFENGNKVFDFLISSGLIYATPRGNFTIQRKLRAKTMSGGSGRSAYYLPNVPWVMFFGNQRIPWSRGFSLHGTYWHNNFGRPMSHGCVNMKTPDAEALYHWAPEGTPVNIY